MNRFKSRTLPVAAPSKPRDTSSTETSDNHGIIEYTYKDAERNGDYVRILFRNNKDKKFGDGDIAMIVYLTDSGIQRFNQYYNKKYEPILI